LCVLASAKGEVVGKADPSGLRLTELAIARDSRCTLGSTWAARRHHGQVLRAVHCPRSCGGSVGAIRLETGPILNAWV